MTNNTSDKKLPNNSSSTLRNSKKSSKKPSTAKTTSTPKKTTSASKKPSTAKTTSTPKKTTSASKKPSTAKTTSTPKKTTSASKKPSTTKTALSTPKKTTSASKKPSTAKTTPTPKKTTNTDKTSKRSTNVQKDSKKVPKTTTTTTATTNATKTTTRNTTTPKQDWVVCLSHKEDLDGISAAALIKQAHGGDTVLTDYPTQMLMLKDIASDKRLKKLFICDLGLSKKNQDDFVSIMDTLRKRRISVTYIDHHTIDPDIAKKIASLGVKLIHDTNECASVLVYETFKSKLNDHATFIAACAAITDYMEDRPVASNLLQVYDRQFTLISATVLTYNIVGHQKENDYLMSLVDALVSSKFPHEITNSFVFARDQVEKLSEIIAKVKSNMKKKKNLAHMEITDAGASGAVNFVLGLSGKDVGIAYKAKKDDDFYAVSVRGSKKCAAHLGKIVNTLAAELGGSGGGHDKACGATIPLPQITRFVSEMNKRIVTA